MKPQTNTPLAQLNLPLLDAAPLALPPDKNQQLIQALTELLLGAASAPTAAKGVTLEPQADH